MPIVYAIEHVMSKPIITVDGEVSAQKAIIMMNEKNIGALIVTENSEPVGIIIERDILKRCCAKASCERINVKEIMSEPLITVDVKTPIGRAVEIMNDKNIRRLIVTEEGEIVGIATQKDLMRGTLEAFYALHSTFWTR